MWSTTGFCPGATSIQDNNDLPLHITNSKVVCDLFADDDSIHSYGTAVESARGNSPRKDRKHGNSRETKTPA